MYNHNYPTCRRTYATLRIYPGELDPTEVTRYLGIQPSLCQWHGKRQQPAKLTYSAMNNGWFLSSKGAVDSKDSRQHIDWLLEQLLPKADALWKLQLLGARMDVCCYWESAEGHGGPVLSPQQMEKLAKLGLECGYDLYFGA